MGNPNAIKWWCEEKQQELYLHSLHKEMPKCCQECKNEKCAIVKDPLTIKKLMWEKECPFNDEVQYERGLYYDGKVKKCSVYRYTAISLIYSIPPPIVHYYRNGFNVKMRKKFKNSIWRWIGRFGNYLIRKVEIKQDKEYFKFASSLAEITQRWVKDFEPGLAHWKNKKMSKSMNKSKLVRGCLKRLDKSNYGK